MPVRIDQFEEVDASVFDEYPQPVPPGKKIDPAWEELLSKIEQGGVIRLPFGDASELRGLRLALGRRAAGRGFKVQTRNDGQTLVVRRSEEPLQPKNQPPAQPPQNGRRTRGRKRTQDQQGTFAAELSTEAEDDLP